ncbi:hypothetical protein IGI04_038688 [Brassica rapa subsp. trilocularis]|uniref:CASP-like protein n=1 Tax=Brassica rapa subsp. trilocularis TaxID=1813537 RepID=A0ABQ7LKW1_BRACM|nr:hypothetical protein IGI04_038688 [Brassica rapa subsp. trilocularis]
MKTTFPSKILNLEGNGSLFLAVLNGYVTSFLNLCFGVSGAAASAAATASMKTVVVRFADAVAYYIATAGFISVSRRTRRQTPLPASTK